MNKKITLMILVFGLMAALFSGCSEQSENYDLGTLVDEISGTGAFSDILSDVSSEMAENLYGYDEADVTECRLLCSTGATAEEVGLFECRDTAAAARVEEKAEARAQSQKSAYEAYAPAEIPKLDDAVIMAKGRYVFYIVSTDAEKVDKVLEQS